MQHTKSFKSVNGSNLNEWYKTTLIHVRRNLDANSYRKGRRSRIYPSPEMKVISKDETVPGRKFIPEQDWSPKTQLSVHTKLCTKTRWHPDGAPMLFVERPRWRSTKNFPILQIKVQKSLFNVQGTVG